MSPTPGPWIVLTSSYYVQITAAGDFLASCYAPNGVANARLMAAAPEMLAALKTVRRLARAFCRSCDGHLHDEPEPMPEGIRHSDECQAITAALNTAEKENNNEQ